jgi:hypothetical protein
MKSCWGVFVMLSWYIFFVGEVVAKDARKKENKTQSCKFTKVLAKVFVPDDHRSMRNEFIWNCRVPSKFDELIPSWNGYRPRQGKVAIWIRVRHACWSSWKKLAEWEKDSQRTFLNTSDPFVHIKHVRVEMQQGRLANAFQIKVVYSNHRGRASQDYLNALFACCSNISKAPLPIISFSKPSTYIKQVPRQSQMVLGHDRASALCSPTSLGIITKYFNKRLFRSFINDMEEYVINFAEKAYDGGDLNIYGNWLLNVAEAYQTTKGNLWYRTERLNGFAHLYRYIAKGIPIAVSVRGLAGGATPYANGHFLVVIGWKNKTQEVVCIDPAFNTNKETTRLYGIDDFVKAWGFSRYLSYVPITNTNTLN